MSHLFDMITFWSTIPGKFSFRDIYQGSWFIQTFCEVIDQHGDSWDVLRIFTKVCNILKEKKGPSNQAMVPIQDSNLSKRLCFNGAQ